MKNIAVFLFLAVTLASSAIAQKRVHPKDVEGTTWQMVFDLDKEADNAIERIALKMAEGFMDEINIQFEFEKKNTLRVHVDAFGKHDEDEDEYSEWHINDEGQLTLGDTDSFESDDTVFMRDGDRLVAFEYERGRHVLKESFYLVQVER